MRVLVVDDSIAARLMIREMLRSRGHEVVGEADTLDKTLSAYQSLKPDLVTLDISMTQEDGVAVLKGLRQVDPKARVLIVSGNSQPKLREELKAQGAGGFVAKPFTADELGAAAERVAAG